MYQSFAASATATTVEGSLKWPSSGQKSCCSKLTAVNPHDLVVAVADASGRVFHDLDIVVYERNPVLE